MLGVVGLFMNAERADHRLVIGQDVALGDNCRVLAGLWDLLVRKSMRVLALVMFGLDSRMVVLVWLNGAEAEV
jgi:hypothetical protein